MGCTNSKTKESSNEEFSGSNPQKAPQGTQQQPAGASSQQAASAPAGYPQPPSGANPRQAAPPANGGSGIVGSDGNPVEVNKRMIGMSAQEVIDSSVQFRNTVETVVPLGKHSTAHQLMLDDTPIKHFFSGSGMPAQIAGVGETSFVQMLNTMKLLCGNEATKKCTDDLAARRNVHLDEAQLAKFSKTVNTESAKAVQQMVEQYVKSVFARVQTEGADAVSKGVSYESQRRPGSATPTNKNDAGVVLPAGNWVHAEGSPFYWSDDEKLFYHPESAQFFDPETNKWYDPETDEWYDEDEQ